MKSIYIAAQQEENGKFHAFLITIKTGSNIKPILERYRKAKVFQPCKTRKEAEKLVEYWNECFKYNGTFSVIRED